MEDKYKAFIKKWIGRVLNESPYDTNRNRSIITRYTTSTFTSREVSGTVTAEVLDIPRSNAWKDSKQRRQFAREAKEAGFKPTPERKCEYYRIVVS